MDGPVEHHQHKTELWFSCDFDLWLNPNALCKTANLLLTVLGPTYSMYVKRLLMSFWG